MTLFNELCKALSHNTRRNMLEELSKNTKGITFKEFCSIFNANPNTIAFHTKQLIKSKLVLKTGKYHITQLGKKAFDIRKNFENKVVEKLMKESGDT